MKRLPLQSGPTAWLPTMLFLKKKIALCLIGYLFVSACQQNPYRDGADLYKSQCANCHMDSGEGLSALIPTLAKSDYLEKNREKLPCILWHGLQDTISVNGRMYAEQMPPNLALTEVDITNILNFVNTTWGNQNPLYTLEEVKKALEKCPK